VFISLAIARFPGLEAHLKVRWSTHVTHTVNLCCKYERKWFVILSMKKFRGTVLFRSEADIPLGAVASLDPIVLLLPPFPAEQNKSF